MILCEITKTRSLNSGDRIFLDSELIKLDLPFLRQGTSRNTLTKYALQYKVSLKDLLLGLQFINEFKLTPTGGRSFFSRKRKLLVPILKKIFPAGNSMQTLYRGEYEGVVVGRKVKYSGITSWTKNKEIAKKFSTTKMSDYFIKAEIDSSKIIANLYGSPLLKLVNNRFDLEDEVIVDRGTFSVAVTRFDGSKTRAPLTTHSFLASLQTTETIQKEIENLPPRYLNLLRKLPKNPTRKEVVDLLKRNGELTSEWTHQDVDWVKIVSNISEWQKK